MASVIAHRGPDADGFYVGPGVGLGHRRLSIIDLSTGDQPLANEDGTVWSSSTARSTTSPISAPSSNAHGHRFRTHTDTEVIVHAYEQWGDRARRSVPRHVRLRPLGRTAAPLLLARDRLGIKPLYYATAGSGVVFGSEIKSLLEDPDVPRAWSPEALDAYLALQYVPSPRTIYREIWKLPPGHLLVAEHGRVSVRATGISRSPATATPRARRTISTSSTRSFRIGPPAAVSDVPLGAFLSGGIDSSAVVAAMVERAPRASSRLRRIRRCGFNELEYARTVATHLGTESFEKIVQPDIVDLLPKLAWHFDEPFADSSAVPTYYVSKAARERVTVALSGDGGDELWAGYARHRVEQLGRNGPAMAGTGRRDRGPARPGAAARL